MLPMYYVAAYCGGDAMGFEKLKDGQLVLYPENGLIAHSNHIRHPHYAYQVDALGGTLYRDRRILKHLQPKAGAVTMEDIKDAFKDHFGYPFSVCRHGDSRKTELNRISTLGCILMDVTDRRIWVCKGTPCCGEFKEYMWERPHKKSDWDQIEKW